MTTTPDCPICGKPRNALHRPFCSRRCQEIDLGRWFQGSYAIPAVEPPDEFDLDGEDWRSELEANRRSALGLGLWGVPSFRLIGPEGEPDFCTWGQDRIWLLEEEIARRCARTA